MAWTDPLRISINPLTTISASIFNDKIKELIGTGEVDLVVFGLPTHTDNTLTKVGEKVKAIINNYSKKYPNVQFETVDESFTSVQAKNLLIQLGVKKSERRKKEKVDQMSAVIILKNYLNSLS